jgi:alkanesulfonate monooxygenase SsuD/methylene tetrahydromethanopterin reductase-like flavin-dependent oxidoreductase (luciferase family)
VPIHLAALGPAMSRLAGEVADGVFAHPVCTARYLREVLLPAVAEGARRAGRSPGDVEIVGAPIVVAAVDEEELREEKQLLKRRVAFYASTRTYHPVFAVHGWDALGARLHALSLESCWDEMVALIPDEMAEEFGTVARVEEVGAIVAERWGGSARHALPAHRLPAADPRGGAPGQGHARAGAAPVALLAVKASEDRSASSWNPRP